MLSPSYDDDDSGDDNDREHHHRNDDEWWTMNGEWWMTLMMIIITIMIMSWSWSWHWYWYRWWYWWWTHSCVNMRERISTHITKMLGEQGIWEISPFIFFSGWMPSKSRAVLMQVAESKEWHVQWFYDDVKCAKRQHIEMKGYEG